MSLVGDEKLHGKFTKFWAQNAIVKIKEHKDRFAAFMTLDVEEESYTKTVESFFIQYAEIKSKYDQDKNSISSRLEFVELLCIIISFSIHEMCYYESKLIKHVMQEVLKFLSQQIEDIRDERPLSNISIIDRKNKHFNLVNVMFHNTEEWIYSLKRILDENSTANDQSFCPGLTDFAFGILNEKRFFRNQE